MLAAFGPTMEMRFTSGWMGRISGAVLEQHDRLARSLARQPAVLRAADHALRDGGERDPFRRVKNAQLEARQQGAMQGGVDLGFGDQAALDGFAPVYRRSRRS